MSQDLVTPIRSRLAGMSHAERRDVAAATGLPFETVQKISIGVTRNPRVETWSALARYFGISVGRA